MEFSPPVTHVYNPLEYAWQPHRRYLERYSGSAELEVILLGMNPGPFGMAQTGVPFGEVGLVRDWLEVEGAVGRPTSEHPRRPVQGFDCHRSEVSGRRLWGWAKERFVTPESFFRRFFVANYCPLMFMEASGRNRTPDKLPATERAPLLAACDAALAALVELLQPRYVVGVGVFAEHRAKSALQGLGCARRAHIAPQPGQPGGESRLAGPGDSSARRHGHRPVR